MRFYGERSIMWARESELERGCLTERHTADLQTWGRTRQKSAPSLCMLPSHALRMKQPEVSAKGLALLVPHSLTTGTAILC